MPQWRRLAAFFLVAFLAFAPSLADARAGGSYRGGGGGFIASSNRARPSSSAAVAVASPRSAFRIACSAGTHAARIDVDVGIAIASFDAR